MPFSPIARSTSPSVLNPRTWQKLASVNFICSPEEAHQRLKRVEEMGFEEILIGSQFGAIEEIDRVRDFVNS